VNEPLPTDGQDQARLVATYRRLLWWQVICLCGVLLLPLIANAEGADWWWALYLVAVPVTAGGIWWLVQRHRRVMAHLLAELD
jgi:hypothetical protein